MKPLVPSGIFGPEIGLFTELEPEIVGDEPCPEKDIENIRSVNILHCSYMADFHM
jgi:hypothetical protein